MKKIRLADSEEALCKLLKELAFDPVPTPEPIAIEIPICEHPLYKKS